MAFIGIKKIILNKKHYLMFMTYYERILYLDIDTRIFQHVKNIDKEIVWGR
jgi:hypothetical protein